MEKKYKINNPIYQQIATDLASKIAHKQYQIGEKIYARSTLASQYGVSAETARRAISILSDFDIVDTTKGSGVFIKSYENAIQFVHQYNDIQTVNNLKRDIFNSVERQAKETEYLYDCLNKLIDRTERFRSLNPFVPFEIHISSDSPHLNKTVANVNFWSNTYATIIAIRRDENLILSPGPDAMFYVNDILYFIGDDSCYERVCTYMLSK